MNIKRQIEKVILAQDLNKVDAADQVRGRIWEARQYLKRRSNR